MFIFYIACLHSALLTDIPVKVVQPDETKIDVYKSGDEFHNWYHDSEQYTIVQDEKTSFWCWAKAENGGLISTGYPIHLYSPVSLNISPRENISEQRYYQLINKGSHTPDKNNSPPHGGGQLPPLREGGYRGEFSRSATTPSTGTVQSILVFIRFAGEDEFTQELDNFDAIFNDRAENANSVYNYFLAESYNTLEIFTSFFPRPSVAVVESYMDIYPRSYFCPYSVVNPDGYTGGEYGTERKQREHQLLQRAINAIAHQIPETLIIDSDEDGIVDHVNFILKGANHYWNELIWPHQGILDTEQVYIHGKMVQAYNFNIEAASYAGTLCHEIGHSLGLPDLYRHSLSAAPLGDWDIMSLSSYDSPISVYLKYAYTNWISSLPTKQQRIDEIPLITSSGTYSLGIRSSSSTYNIYRINSPNATNEFFVIEYTDQLLESDIFYAAGLLIFRVNSSLYGNASGPPDEFYVYRPIYPGSYDEGLLMLANFTSSLGRDTINDYTNPASLLSDGNPGGLHIYNIGENTFENINFSVMIEDTSSESDVMTDTSFYDSLKIFPNPFNPETTINYAIQSDTFVSMMIFNIKGQKAKTLVDEYQTAGYYSITWNGKNDYERDMGTGIYFLHVKTNNYVTTKRIVFIK